MAAQICETCKHKGKRCYCAPNSTCGAYEKRTTTWLEEFKMMDIDSLAEWIDKYGQFDSSPWMEWWSKKYCDNCEPIMCHYEDSEREFPVSWCELHDNKCKFFPEMDEAPNSKEIVKMWLESEVEE